MRETGDAGLMEMAMSYGIYLISLDMEGRLDSCKVENSGRRLWADGQAICRSRVHTDEVELESSSLQRRL